MRNRATFILAVLGLLTVPVANATPGGSGGAADAGITTRATAKAQITWLDYLPGEEECRYTFKKSGEVQGNLPAYYKYKVPGESSKTKAGPIAGKLGTTEGWGTASFGEFIDISAGSWIDLQGLELDRAEATDTAHMTCGPDAEKCAQQASSPDPSDLLKDFSMPCS